MLAPRHRIAAAVIIMGAAALLLFLGSSGRQSEAALTPGAKTPSSSVNSRTMPVQAAERSVRASVEDENPVKTPLEATPAPTTKGILRGVLFGPTGDVLVNKGISLSLTRNDPALVYSVYTDDKGEFVLSRLPPGHYFVSYTGEKDMDHSCAATLVPEEIDIAPSDNGYVPFTLLGTRSFHGALVDPEARDGQSLEVCLHPVGSRDVLLSNLVTVTNFSLDKKPAPKLDPKDPLDMKYNRPEAQPRNGGFYVEGLPASLVEVTIYYDGEHRLYMREVIDLTDGDVDWGRREIQMDDFYEWMGARHLKELPSD